jgi:serine/threonine protein kinase
LPMQLANGTRLGPYEILGRIGAGGMGEVYRARDSRLDRIVAIKVAGGKFSARFEHEARAVAALNHPNICQLYDVGPNYLVMEFIDGQPLKGPLPLNQALRYASQICDALDAAHLKAITHRDLKPTNILVTKSGVIKLLDFGLAKMGQPPVQIGEDDATQPMQLTTKGQILGTLHYMAPEQLQGQEIDARTDIFSFGVVLHEILTGKRAFDGASPASVIATILQSQAPSVGHMASPSVDHVLRRCLEKDPENRWQSARDVKIALELASRQLEDSMPAPSTSKPLRWMAATGVLAVAVAAMVIAYAHQPTQVEHTTKSFVLPPVNAVLNPNSLPAVSPDGRRLAFAATAEGVSSLWVRDLDSLDTRVLLGTEAGYDPFWSPDSRSLAFFADGKLKKINVTGGPAFTLADAPVGRGGAWSPRGVIVFTLTARSGLYRVPATGGTATPVTMLDPSLPENSHRFPSFLPDGHRFLYTAMSLQAGKSAIYVGDVDSEPASQPRQPILSVESNVVYAPPGYVLFIRERSLMAQPFDADQVRPSGEPMLIAEHLDYLGGNVQGQFAASQNGVLTYVSGALAGNVQLTWIDRAGKVLDTVGAPGILARPAISPDGKTVAVPRQDPQTGYYDLWLYDLSRGAASRFTFNSSHNDDPIWSPDGKQVAFRTTRHGDWALYEKGTGGSGLEVPLDREPRFKQPMDWSRDGRYILEEVNDPVTKSDIWVLPLEGERKPFPVLQTAASERSPRLSPDGKWLAYVSDETRRDEVYVQAFLPNTAGIGNRWQVSTNGATRPVWSRDGKELYFIGAEQRMMAVSMNSSGVGLKPGPPQVLFDSHIASENMSFDIDANRRFLIPIASELTTATPLTLVLNWPTGISKR